MTEAHMLLSVDFDAYPNGSAPPDDWWVEGGERVWVDDGHLRVKADPPGARDPGYVCTVWHKTPVDGELHVAFDAHVIDSSCDANNINFFLLYADPAGTPLHETRGDRADGAYGHYHGLNGMIVTFLNDTDSGSGKARFRMRRCPGFRLVDENYDYHCRTGVTYHVELTRLGGEVACAVDGTTYLRWTDPDPLARGLIGFRTYRTDLWWDHLRVTRPG